VSFDLPYLCEKLSVCKSSWFLLGLGLGMKHDILKKIESERTANDVHNCLSDLLMFWLNSGNATVKILVDALVKINMRVLADKIQKKYAGMIGDTLYLKLRVLTFDISEDWPINAKFCTY
jgi:hypothetical protein